MQYLLSHFPINFITQKITDGTLPLRKRRIVLVTEHINDTSTEMMSSGTSLHIIRTLGKAGHRVIFVTVNTNRNSTSSQRKMFVTGYSKYVYKHYNVGVGSVKGTRLDDMATKDSIPSEYEQDQKCILQILEIARKENIDWFIPMSSSCIMKNSETFDWYSELSMGNSLLVDATIAKLLNNMLPEVRSFTNCENPYATRILSDRLYFFLESKRMNLRVPDFHLVESTAELHKLERQGLFSNNKNNYYITSIHQKKEEINNGKLLSKCLFPSNFKRIIDFKIGTRL